MPTALLVLFITFNLLHLVHNIVLFILGFALETVQNGGKLNEEYEENGAKTKKGIEKQQMKIMREYRGERWKKENVFTLYVVVWLEVKTLHYSMPHYSMPFVSPSTVYFNMYECRLKSAASKICS